MAEFHNTGYKDYITLKQQMIFLKEINYVIEKMFIMSLVARLEKQLPILME